jgi:ABC-type uncharacterized transport system involved in gliding motility auxiliary subunit
VNLDRRLAIACLFGGVVLLFVALGLFLAQQQMSSSISYSLIAGVALLICYGLLAPTAAIDLFRSRQARFGSLTVFVSAVVLGVLVMGNVLAARSSYAVDLTSSQRYTLSPKSLAVLKQLDSDVTITGFFRPGSNTSDVENANSLLAQYQKASSHIKVNLVNPDTHAELARKLGVNINGSFALEYKTKQPTVLLLGSQSESDFTSAILKLEASRTPQVCWASGEGERDLGETQDFGYSEAKAQLGSDNFKLTPIILSQTPKIPTDCDILALVGIQRAIPDTSVAAIQQYVNGGGSLLLAADPWIDSSLAQSANALVKPYGASFDNGLVLEGDPRNYAQGDSTTPVVFNYGSSPVTRDLSNRLTFFPQSTAITQTDADGVRSVALAQTTNSAYQVMTVRDVNQLARRPGDKAGPFAMMETLEKDLPAGQQGTGLTGTKKGRIVLVGTSAFAENRAIVAQSGYNLQLLLGSFDWLAGNDQLIALPAKPPAASPLLLTDQDFNLNFLIVMVLVPLLIALAGVAVYLRRRATYSPA